MYSCDIGVSKLFNLLLASIRILLCLFFLFPVMLNIFFVIPVIKGNKRVKLALAIPAETHVTLGKEIMDTPRLVADKSLVNIINVLSI